MCCDAVNFLVPFNMTVVLFLAKLTPQFEVSLTLAYVIGDILFVQRREEKKQDALLGHLSLIMAYVMIE